MEYINFYKEYCKSINSETYQSVVDTVLECIISDEKCSPENKMLFSDWISSKIYNMIKLPRQKRNEVRTTLENNIYLIKSAPVLALYLYFIDHDLSINLCSHVYANRLASNFFINQMLNDSTLLKHYRYTLEEDEYLNHFITWIKQTDNNDQKSNLLDILLSDHDKDARVKDIFSEMKGGDSLYENKQNVHADEIAIPIKTACVELLKWSENNKNYEYIVPDEASEVDRGGWIKEFFIESKIENTLVQGILQRTMIDRNNYNLVAGEKTTLFEMLYAVCNYISKSDNKQSLYNILEEEMRGAIELCGSGYLARFINVLQGVDERFQIKIDFFHQLHSKINDIIMKAIIAAGAESDIVLGTYDEKYQSHYFNFIIQRLNLQQLYDQYGEDDVRANICPVLNKITGTNLWKIGAGIFYDSA